LTQAKAVDFHLFSGTGNTLLVVRAMREVFARCGWATRCFRMEEASPADVSLDRTLGLAFPVAAQSTYPLVWEFFKGLPQATGTPAFMVDTMMMYSGGIVGPLRSLLKRKGYRPIGAQEIRMPNNLYTRRPHTAKNAAIVARGLEKARGYAEELVEGRARWGRVPLLPDLMRLFANGPWTWWTARAAGKLLKVDLARCTRCGQCARLCPVGNITLDEYPVHGGRCQQCMRCISFCPTGAISLMGLRSSQYRAVAVDAILEEELSQA